MRSRKVPKLELFMYGLHLNMRQPLWKVGFPWADPEETKILFSFVLFRFGQLLDAVKEKIHLYFPNPPNSNILTSIFIFCQKVNNMKYMPSHFSLVQLFVTPRTVARQAPLSMGFPGENTGVGCHALPRGPFWPRDHTCFSYVSCIGRQVLYH